MPLLPDNFKVFLHAVKFRLKNLLLDFGRLRYLAELVMRHDDAVIVVILHLVEEGDTVLRLETLFIGIENPRVGIGGLIGHGNFRHIRFHSDNHRFVGQSQTLHLMGCHTHD